MNALEIQRRMVLRVIELKIFIISDVIALSKLANT